MVLYKSKSYVRAFIYMQICSKSDLLALVCDVYCIFVTFPCGIMGQVWCLIVSFPDLCRLSYLKLTQEDNSNLKV